MSQGRVREGCAAKRPMPGRLLGFMLSFSMDIACHGLVLQQVRTKRERMARISGASRGPSITRLKVLAWQACEPTGTMY